MERLSDYLKWNIENPHNVNFKMVVSKEDREDTLQAMKDMIELFDTGLTTEDIKDIFIKYFEEQGEEKVNNWKVLTNEHADKWDEYQEAERQGTLLHLPCKAGDTVYLEAEYENEITEGRVTEISLLPDGVCIYIEREIGSGCSEGYGVNDFGYDVFLKREDAERAIKEELDK